MMSTSFDDWSSELDRRAAAEADAGDDTRSRLSRVFAAHYVDAQHQFPSVPEQLAAARKARHLSQSQLAEMSGVDQAAISRIERGQINTSLDTIARLSSPLGLHVALVDHSGHALSR